MSLCQVPCKLAIAQEIAAMRASRLLTATHVVTIFLMPKVAALGVRAVYGRGSMGHKEVGIFNNDTLCRGWGGYLLGTEFLEPDMQDKKLSAVKCTDDLMSVCVIASLDADEKVWLLENGTVFPLTTCADLPNMCVWDGLCYNEENEASRVRFKRLYFPALFSVIGLLAIAVCTYYFCQKSGVADELKVAEEGRGALLPTAETPQRITFRQVITHRKYRLTWAISFSLLAGFIALLALFIYNWMIVRTLNPASDFVRAECTVTSVSHKKDERKIMEKDSDSVDYVCTDDTYRYDVMLKETEFSFSHSETKPRSNSSTTCTTKCEFEVEHLKPSYAVGETVLCWRPNISNTLLPSDNFLLGYSCTNSACVKLFYPMNAIERRIEQLKWSFIPPIVVCFYLFLFFGVCFCCNVYGQLISDDEEEREKLMMVLNSTEHGMLSECRKCKMRVEANTLNVHKCAGPWPLANWRHMQFQGNGVACSRCGRTREEHRFERHGHLDEKENTVWHNYYYCYDHFQCCACAKGPEEFHRSACSRCKDRATITKLQADLESLIRKGRISQALLLLSPVNKDSEVACTGGDNLGHRPKFHARRLEVEQVRLGPYKQRIDKIHAQLLLASDAPVPEDFERLMHKGTLDASPLGAEEWQGFPQALCVRAVTQQAVSALQATTIKSLSVAGNPHLTTIPLRDLCSISSLEKLDCTDCPLLESPPMEVASMGGAEVVDFTRSCDGVNSSLALFMVGDGEAGKTSLRRALMNEESNTCAKIAADHRTVGMDRVVWDTKDTEGNRLIFQVNDVAGQKVYHNLHELFLVDRAVYLFVWRADDKTLVLPPGATSTAALSQATVPKKDQVANNQKATSQQGRASNAQEIQPGGDLWTYIDRIRPQITTWLNLLQARVPGVNILPVVTHIDCVDKATLDKQCALVKRVFEEWEDKQAKNIATDKRIQQLQMLNSGDSLRVNCLDGEGIFELRTAILEAAQRTKGYREPMPQRWINLRERLGEVKKTKRFITWDAYKELARTECGIEQRMLLAATSFLHETLALRYFGIDLMKGQKKDFEDFLRIFISTQDAEMVGDVRALFDRIDKDRSGEVDKDELQEFLRVSGLKDANVDAMMACVDTDKSGKIDFDEFRRSFEAAQMSASSDVLSSTVYLDMDWMIDVLKGVVRHDHAALNEYLVTEKKLDLVHKVRKMRVQGIIYKELFDNDFLWPGKRTPFWSKVASGSTDNSEYERELWWVSSTEELKKVVQDEQEKVVAMGLLEGFKIILPVSADRSEFFCVDLVPQHVKHTIECCSSDSQACQYRFSRRYAELPSGFWNSLFMEMRSVSSSGTISTHIQTFFLLSAKVQITKHMQLYNGFHVIFLDVRASTAHALEVAKASLAKVSKFYAGISGWLISEDEIGAEDRAKIVEPAQVLVMTAANLTRKTAEAVANFNMIMAELDSDLDKIRHFLSQSTSTVLRVNTLNSMEQAENTQTSGPLVIHAARYGWAEPIWDAELGHVTSKAKDVTDIVRQHIDDLTNELHINPKGQKDYLTRLFWPEMAGSHHDQKLAVIYSFGDHQRQTLEVNIPRISHRRHQVHIPEVVGLGEISAKVLEGWWCSCLFYVACANGCIKIPFPCICGALYRLRAKGNDGLVREGICSFCFWPFCFSYSVQRKKGSNLFEQPKEDGSKCVAGVMESDWSPIDAQHTGRMRFRCGRGCGDDSDDSEEECPLDRCGCPGSKCETNCRLLKSNTFLVHDEEETGKTAGSIRSLKRCVDDIDALRARVNATDKDHFTGLLSLADISVDIPNLVKDVLIPEYQACLRAERRKSLSADSAGRDGIIKTSQVVDEAAYSSPDKLLFQALKRGNRKEAEAQLERGADPSYVAKHNSFWSGEVKLSSVDEAKRNGLGDLLHSFGCLDPDLIESDEILLRRVEAGMRLREHLREIELSKTKPFSQPRSMLPPIFSDAVKTDTMHFLETLFDVIDKRSYVWSNVSTTNAGISKEIFSPNSLFDGKAQVVLVLLDEPTTRSPQMCERFRDFERQGCKIIGIPMPGYDIANYRKWWPDSMPEFERHSLFFDCRDAKLWRNKIRDELLPQLLQFLEEWSDAKPRIIEWDVEDRLAAETAGKAETVQQKKYSSKEELRQCMLPCPSCLQERKASVGVFSRDLCMLSFMSSKKDTNTKGVLFCSMCQQNVKVKDVLKRPLFLSYNWGCNNSTQKIAKPLCERIFLETEMPYWLDIHGGMGFGDELITEMREGVVECDIVILMISDAFCNSDNCLREFIHMSNHRKYIIPLLVPDHGETRTGHSGWTGAYVPGDEDWWKHAESICTCKDPDAPDKEIPWSYLASFTPIDLRSEILQEDGSLHDNSAAENEIIRRIMSRFFRVQ